MDLNIPPAERAAAKAAAELYLFRVLFSKMLETGIVTPTFIRDVVAGAPAGAPSAIVAAYLDPLLKGIDPVN